MDGRLGELAALFTRLGFTAFGGPAAHIAMMRREVVERRRWLDDRRFIDLIGATNLIPGPNSTEMAMHIGHERARWKGLVVAGVCFILPAAAIVLVLARAYVEHGTTPEAEGLLYGVKPVVIAIVVHALWGLSLTALRSPLTASAAVAAGALYLFGVNELALLFGGALIVLVVRAGLDAGSRAGAVAVPALYAVAESFEVDLARLFALFLKIGAVLYGSGYVLLAFLRGDFVVRLGWLTETQLLDAIAIGQFTPGPVFTTATFVGYVLAGMPGAVLATVGIFLPGFFFVAAINPIVTRARSSAWTSALLDGVNAAALGLMAAVTIELGRSALIDAPTAALAAAALVVLWRTEVNSAWLVLAGGVGGLLLGAP